MGPRYPTPSSVHPAPMLEHLVSQAIACRRFTDPRQLELEASHLEPDSYASASG